MSGKGRGEELTCGGRVSLVGINVGPGAHRLRTGASSLPSSESLEVEPSETLLPSNLRFRLSSNHNNTSTILPTHRTSYRQLSPHLSISDKDPDAGYMAGIGAIPESGVDVFYFSVGYHIFCFLLWVVRV